MAVLLALLLAPTASAWALEVEAPLGGELSVRGALLVAGALHAEARDAVFGAPEATSLDLGEDLRVEWCPDRAGAPAPSGCPGGNVTEPARLRVFAGGVVVTAPAGVAQVLDAPMAAAALGGGNVSAGGRLVGPALFAAGTVSVASEGDAFVVRPAGRDPSLLVEGPDGPVWRNGTAFTLYVSQASGARLDAPGAFLELPPDATLRVSPAPLAVADRAQPAEALHALMRGLLPGDKVDRRADVATAFGPFQVVPAFLNGVVAAHANLTVGGEAQDAFFLARVDDLSLRVDGDAVAGAGNATYLVQGASLAASPGGRETLPWILTVLLGVAALAARAFTVRRMPPRRARMVRAALRLLVAAALLLLAAGGAARLLGVPWRPDDADLSVRSRAQLLALASAMALLAHAMVGLPTASLVRSLLSWRRRERAALLPVLSGGAAAALLLLLEGPAVLAAVARMVRL